jgi:hypothetical protein
MYSHLANNIKDVVVKRKELELETDRQTVTPAAAPRQHQNHNKDFRQRYGHGNKFKKPEVERGMEMAMNATTNVPFQTGKNNGNVHHKTIPPGYNVISDVEYTRRIITPSEKMCYLIPQTSNYGSYTSTEKPCPSCSDKNTNNHHAIRCYLGKCTRCLYHGHIQSVCRQPVPSKQTANAAEIPATGSG